MPLRLKHTPSTASTLKGDLTKHPIICKTRFIAVSNWSLHRRLFNLRLVSLKQHVVCHFLCSFQRSSPGTFSNIKLSKQLARHFYKIKFPPSLPGTFSNISSPRTFFNISFSRSLPVTFCNIIYKEVKEQCSREKYLHLFIKKCLPKKSAWQPASAIVKNKRYFAFKAVRSILFFGTKRQFSVQISYFFF